MTARQLWEEFALAVVPVDAPPAQRREMRRAFYGGLTAMLVLARRLGEDDVPEDAGVGVLQSLWDEVNAFSEAVERGEA